MKKDKTNPDDEGLREYFKNSKYGLFYGPIIDYTVKLAEIMLLAVAFRVAATQTDNALLEGVASFFLLCGGVLIGNVSGIITHLMGRRDLGTPAMRVLVGLFAFVAFAAVSLWVAIEMVDAVNEMVAVGVAID